MPKDTDAETGITNPNLSCMHRRNVNEMVAWQKSWCPQAEEEKW